MRTDTCTACTAETELDRPSRVACSDLLGCMVR